MKKLPIGIQTFRELIEEGYYYVDKTEFIYNLVSLKKYFFLSRPRRFGKSLFLSTLKSAFNGEKELFEGLYLENNWDWSKKYPILYISFGGVTEGKSELKIMLQELLDRWKREYQIKKLDSRSIRGQFLEIIELLHNKFNKKVVILIDEYDKPILDMINKTDLAVEVRDELKNFYSVIKDSDEYLKFVFLTGVTKFSKVSLFSGLNNLEDITLDENYATICGYTQNDIETVFKERLFLDDKDKKVDLERLKLWYNGYNFLGEGVYNPFDILLFFSKNNTYRTYWFETATPTFLIKLLMKNRYFIPNLENLQVSEDILGSFDIDKISIETLLFQTGYLTIDRVEEVFQNISYVLKYPNHEVKTSLNKYIFDYLIDKHIGKFQTNFFYAIRDNKIEDIKKNLFSLFASIPNDNYRKNEIANYEGYYASVLYSYFAGMGVESIAEDVTNKGYIDMTLFFEDRAYILEFKVLNSTPKTNTALKQIKTKKYYEKYLSKYNKIYQIGIVFNKKKRNIVKFDYELVK